MVKKSTASEPDQEQEVEPYSPDPVLAGVPHTVKNGDVHTIDSGVFSPVDLVIIPRLQRGHGPGTASWARSRRLFNNWDPGKVLTIDVAKIKLLEDTEVLRFTGLGVTYEVLPKGTVVYHVMDGGHRVSAVWFSYITEEDPEFTPSYVKEDVQRTIFMANVYNWPKAKTVEDLDQVVSKYFIAKNRDRAAVSRSDQLKMRINQNEPEALNIENAVHSMGFLFPFDVDEAKAMGNGKLATRYNNEGRVVGAVGAIEGVYNFLGTGQFKTTGPMTALQTKAAVAGLRRVLALANVIYPAEDLRRMQVKANNRWLGDWLLGLARVVETNQLLVDEILSSTPKGAKAIARIQGQGKALNKYGPEAWKSIASGVASLSGSTMGTYEQIRSYWMAKALVDEYNSRLRTNRMNDPKPVRVIDFMATTLATVPLPDEEDEDEAV